MSVPVMRVHASKAAWAIDLVLVRTNQQREASDMARCTAPSRGHRSASAAANCPACGGRFSRYGGSSGYSSYSPPSSSHFSSRSDSGGQGGGGRSGRSTKPRWSGSGSSVWYTSEEVRALTPVRANVESLAKRPELRDVFLCHSWDDRQGAAKELYDLLEARGVSVWFSEKDVGRRALAARDR